MRTKTSGLAGTGALAAALLAAPFAAHDARAQRASPMAAGRFAQYCTTPRGNGQLICDAYITGMTDSFGLVQKLPGGGAADSAPTGICVPASASGQQMRKSVVSWLAAHRDLLRKQVGEVVYQALHETYPCSQGKSGGAG